MVMPMNIQSHPTLYRETTCCFTGHRPDRLPSGWRRDSRALSPLTATLDRAIGQAVADGIRLFLSGMALGVDTLAAQLILRRREQGEPVSLGAVLPCPEQDARWGPEDRRRYRRLLDQADWIHIISPRYTPACMGERNFWMARHSSRMIAVFDGQSGGTANAVEHARRMGLQLTLLDPWHPEAEAPADFFAWKP